MKIKPTDRNIYLQPEEVSTCPRGTITCSSSTCMKKIIYNRLSSLIKWSLQQYTFNMIDHPRLIHK